MSNDDIVICDNCKQAEYWDYMHWRDGKMYCRRCIYEIWDKENPNAKFFKFVIKSNRKFSLGDDKSEQY